MDKKNDMFQQKIVNKFDRGTFVSVSKPQLQKQVDPISKNLHQTVFPVRLVQSGNHQPACFL